MHAIPPTPHCVMRFPIAQVAPSTQPVQVVLTHLPDLHVVPFTHSMHARPSTPQAVALVPATQLPDVESTQPAHATLGPHTPSVQVSVSAQAAQASPPVPQLESVVLRTQIAPLQQPAQLSALQVLAGVPQPAASATMNKTVKVARRVTSVRTKDMKTPKVNNCLQLKPTA